MSWSRAVATPDEARAALADPGDALDLRAAAEREEVAGILIASEYPIYGRFGYGPGADRLSLAVDARAIRFLEPSSGSVELADLATLAELGPELYERSRREQPGAITRTSEWWDTWCEVTPYPGEDPFKGFVAVGRDEHGAPEGLSPEAFGRWAADQIGIAIENEGPDTVAAVFLEPVQNAGGCFPPPPGYFERVREICDQYDVLLVSDEVICAFGRVG